MTLKIETFDQKLADFDRLEGSFLTLLGILTPEFWPFWGSKKSTSEHFQSFFRVVLNVFEKAYFWMYFQIERLINDSQNRNFGENICSFWPFLGVIFDHFGVKKVVFSTF